MFEFIRLFAQIIERPKITFNIFECLGVQTQFQRHNNSTKTIRIN